MEKRNFNKKVISSLLTDEGKHIVNTEDVSRELVSFYTKLYTSKGVNTEAQSAFLNEEVPQLSNGDCEEDITMHELGVALKNLPNGKTLGTDGLSTDFYKFYWPQIKELVYESLTHALITGKLSIDQRRGVITLIPKKGFLILITKC